MSKLDKLIEKYENEVKQLLNPDDIETWVEIGFEEGYEPEDTIKIFLEKELGEQDYYRWEEYNMKNIFIKELKELRDNK